jgi:hypothetical protein
MLAMREDRGGRDEREFFACSIDSVEYESGDGCCSDRPDTEGGDQLERYCGYVDEEKELETGRKGT